MLLAVCPPRWTSWSYDSNQGSLDQKRTAVSVLLACRIELCVHSLIIGVRIYEGRCLMRSEWYARVTRKTRRTTWLNQGNGVNPNGITSSLSEAVHSRLAAAGAPFEPRHIMIYVIISHAD